jgi:hypothetical protein
METMATKGAAGVLSLLVLGVVYKYKIETSNDNTNWTQVVDKTANTSTGARLKPIALQIPPGVSELL